MRGQRMCDPERHTAAGFDFHECLTGCQQRRAVNRTAERKVAAAVPDILVKGDAEVTAVQRTEGLALIREKDRGTQRSVICPEILDFVGNLGKELIDKLRCRNGNLEITVSKQETITAEL